MSSCRVQCKMRFNSQISVCLLRCEDLLNIFSSFCISGSAASGSHCQCRIEPSDGVPNLASAALPGRSRCDAGLSWEICRVRTLGSSIDTILSRRLFSYKRHPTAAPALETFGHPWLQLCDDLSGLHAGCAVGTSSNALWIYLSCRKRALTSEAAYQELSPCYF